MNQNENPEWQPINTAPTDTAVKFEVWHTLWKCPLPVMRLDKQTAEATGTEFVAYSSGICWVKEAFTHWRPASTPPKNT